MGKKGQARTMLDPHRRKLVEQLISLQFTGSSLTAAVMEQLGLKKAQSCAIIAAVYREMAAEAVLEAPMRRNQLRKTLQFFIQRAAADKDYRAVAAYTAQLAKIDGLNAPERVEHSGAVDVSAMTPAQQEARLRELEAKRAAFLATGGNSARGGVQSK